MNTNRVFTIPNLLSLFRLLLIPCIVWLYCTEKYYATAGVVLLSGLTDILDGKIARRFHMVSDLGKILDPVADKLTQGVLILCLAFRHRGMICLIILFVLKEAAMALLGYMAIRRQKKVNSAKWYGKVNTVLLYAVMFSLILFPSTPETVVTLLICICAISIILAIVLYARYYSKILKGCPSKEENG